MGGGERRGAARRGADRESVEREGGDEWTGPRARRAGRPTASGAAGLATRRVGTRTERGRPGERAAPRAAHWSDREEGGTRRGPRASVGPRQLRRDLSGGRGDGGARSGWSGPGRLSRAPLTGRPVARCWRLASPRVTGRRRAWSARAPRRRARLPRLAGASRGSPGAAEGERDPRAAHWKHAQPTDAQSGVVRNPREARWRRALSPTTRRRRARLATARSVRARPPGGGGDPRKSGQLAGCVLTQQPGGEAAQLQIGTLHVRATVKTQKKLGITSLFAAGAFQFSIFLSLKNQLSAFAGFTHP